ncbi:DNA-processing protein DprA [Ideonella sp.]|uniref:DNA-processing protein DprA n=1 Tax=Ideonella sp. TaxID=1929293 RepID=UPI003BB7E07A
MDDAAPAETLAWLQLDCTPGLGPASVRRLLAAFGSPQAVLAAGAGAWREVAGVSAAQALLASPEPALAAAGTAWQWLKGDRDQRHLITLADAHYPAALLNIPDPPCLLYALGKLDRLAQPAVAIVGSRDATAQGLSHSRHFAAELSQAGMCVVSGLALGIDGAAHEGALTAPGSTIAVVGTGLDRVYPRRHQALARQIAAQGLLLSEYLPGTPSLSANFPRRNRIIAGLSQGTLVVEATLGSGSLITARLANEFGRDVYAIPGSILSPQSRGCHQLIRDGAALVETPAEVLTLLAPGGGAGVPRSTAHGSEWTPDAASDAPEDTLLAALGHDPLTVDALAARTGLATDVLLARLLLLELEGQVARLPGGLLQRQGRA